MKLIYIALLSYTFLLTPNMASAKVYKCKTATGVKYQSAPCSIEEKKQGITNSHMLTAHGADGNSLHGHIYSIDEVKKNWRCNSIEEAFESLPSRLSIAYVLNDYANMSKEKLSKKAVINYRKGLARAEIKVAPLYSRNPCKFKLNTSIRSDRRSIYLTINSGKLTKTADKELKERWLVSVLKKNGYTLKGGDTRNNGVTRYADRWKNKDAKCKANFSFNKDSADRISSVRFDVNCATTQQ